MPTTPQEIREKLARNGVSLAAWARQHGFSESLTYRVMRGHRAKLGQSHRIAVALGLKEGTVNDVSELEFAARDMRQDAAKQNDSQSNG